MRTGRTDQNGERLGCGVISDDTARGTTVRKRARRSLAASVALTAVAVTLLTGGAAAAAEPAHAGAPGRAPGVAATCGLHPRGDQGYYTNCSLRNQWVLVTKIWSKNEHFCVPALQTVWVGKWSNVWNAYVEGYDCKAP